MMSIDPVVAAVIVLLVFMFIKVPVFLSLISAAVTYFILTPNVPQLIVAQRLLSGMESIPMLAIPFFVCSGIFMNSTGVTKRIMEFCSVLTCRMAGGLAQVNVLLSTLMGGLSGSSLADAAMEAKMLVPEMEKKGYSKEFSTVVTAASAMITPIIPPGLSMVLYGSIASVSIGKIFVAGIGPGLLLCVTLMLMVNWISNKRGYEVESKNVKRQKGELWAAFKKALLPLFLPVIIIGGIRIGLVTATEAGALAVAYSLLLGLLYRELSWQKIIDGLKETVITTSIIMLIVGAASAFAWVLTKEKIPQTLMEFFVATISNKYVFLLVVNVFLLIVGMFVEGNASLIVLVPLLAPIAKEYGIDSVQFALTFVFNIGIGCITPPLGTLMFVTCGITGCKIKNFIRECIPFYALAFTCLLLITYVPFFTQFFVNLIY